MASVASPPRPVGAAPPPVRHGTTRLTLRINGVDYTLRRLPSPEGFRSVWMVRKHAPHATATYTVAVPKGAQPGCTCPDHEINKCICKHVMALAAWGLIPQPKAARPVKARTRQLHAKNARQAIAEAKALPAEARRHLAEIASLPESWQLGGAGRAALAAASAAPAPSPAPAPAAPSFAAGFRQAVADHIARRNGTAAPEAEWPICEGCGCDFDPEISRDPAFCEACMSEGGAA